MLKNQIKHHEWKFCIGVLWMMLAAIPVFSQTQTPDINLTVYRDLVRFAVQSEVQAWHVEVFSPSGEKLFDSDFVTGQVLDWRLSSQSDQPLESGLYAYTITIKDALGIVSKAQQGSVIIDQAREGLEPAPPQNPWTAERPLGKWDVDQGTKAHTINTLAMGIGAQNPLARLHVGAGAVAPITTGSTLLVEEGAATGMVLKSTTGAEMFFYQDRHHGLVGTASAHPLGIRTNNLNRLWIARDGNVGIHTMNPSSPFTVAGMIEVTSGGIKFPDGTIQTTAVSGGGDGITRARAGPGRKIGIGPALGPEPVVKLLNGLTGSVTLAAGSNITIGRNFFTRTLTISATGGAGGVAGSGTAGKIAKWTGASTISNSVITEISGNVGIGTTMPTSPLTVAGSTIPALPIIAGINNGTGVGVFGNANTGVYGLSPVLGGEGVLGVTFGGSSKAVHGVDQFGGFAGFFEGKVHVNGNVDISSKNILTTLSLQNANADGVNWTMGSLGGMTSLGSGLFELFNPAATPEPGEPVPIHGIPAISIDANHNIALGQPFPGAKFHITGGAKTGTSLLIDSQGSADLIKARDLSTGMVRFRVDRATGSIFKTGTVNFVESHPADPAKEIVYVSLEGPEAGTYLRGTAQLVDGKGVIDLPEHFGLVTSDDGLTVQLTPQGEWLQLYIAQKSAKQIIVREASGKSGKLDYLVQGVRKGYENHQVIRNKQQ